MFTGSTGWLEGRSWGQDSWVSSTSLLDSQCSVDLRREIQSAFASSQLSTIPWPLSARTAYKETAFPCKCNQQVDAWSALAFQWRSLVLGRDTNYLDAVGLQKKEEQTSGPLLPFPRLRMPSHLLRRGTYQVKDQEIPSNLSDPSMPGKKEEFPSSRA